MTGEGIVREDNLGSLESVSYHNLPSVEPDCTNNAAVDRGVIVLCLSGSTFTNILMYGMRGAYMWAPEFITFSIMLGS